MFTIVLYAAVAAFIDGDDTSYLMHPQFGGIVKNFDWTENGAKGILFTELPAFIKAYESAKAAKLSDSEIAWINGYHAQVREAVMSHLSDHEMGWLLQATAAI